MKPTNEIMQIIAEKRQTIPAFLLVELQERDKEIEVLRQKVAAVEKALADGVQPCPGGITGEGYRAWLYSVLPFLEEEEHASI